MSSRLLPNKGDILLIKLPNNLEVEMDVLEVDDKRNLYWLKAREVRPVGPR